MKSIFKILIIIILLICLTLYREDFQNKVIFNMDKLVIKGTDGDKGDVGFKGPPGNRGEQGIQGVTGDQGPQGKRGKVGNKGSDGIDMIPKKLIILWYARTPIPSGWVECNGSNGTPDLRNRYIKGRYNDSSVTKGGRNYVKITRNQMPRHTHSCSATGNHRHSGRVITAGAHSHVWSASRQHTGVDDHNNSTELSRGDRGHWDRYTKGTTAAGNHRHYMYIRNSGNHAHNISSDGSSVPMYLNPKYISLIYIMKI